MKPSLFVPVFTIFIGLCCYVIYTTLKLYANLGTGFLQKAILASFIIFPLLVIVTNLIGSLAYSKINAFFYTVTTIWLGTMLFLLIASIVLLPLHFLIGHFPVAILRLIITSVTVVACALSAYGIYNASRPVVTTMQVTSPALAPHWKGKKIVLFSDTHLGLVRGKAFAQKVVDLVNTQNPDLVLMAGDMIDGPKVPYDDFSAPFGGIRSTFGTYYTPGNHEWYNVEPEKFIASMKHVTHELIDTRIIVNGTQIVGINYGREYAETTRARLETTGYDTTLPAIAIMHDPMNNDVLIQEGVQLVVSGHTHCGQFWPFSFIVKRIYKDKAYGVRQLGDQATITTCGIGTAQTPFRIGNKPEIVVIEIQ